MWRTILVLLLALAAKAADSCKEGEDCSVVPDVGTLQQMMKSHKWLSIKNELQQLFHHMAPEVQESFKPSFEKLPEVVVVGPQSVGKSTTLEMIAGMNFLPRGTSTTTKRPFQISLIPSIDGEALAVVKVKDDATRDSPPYRADEHEYSLDNVGEIEKLKDYLSSLNHPNRFIDDPVELKIYHPDFVFQIEVIDLPGLVVSGDDIKQVEDLVRKHCERMGTIILLIHAGDMDLENNAAFNFIKSIDGYAKRTLGLLTKLNKHELVAMGNSGHAKNNLMLLGGQYESIPSKVQTWVQNGWYGITGQNQSALDQKTQISVTIAEEATFFKTNSLYASASHAVQKRLGTVHLTKKIASLLQADLDTALISLSREMGQGKLNAEERLKKFGKPPPATARERENHVKRLVERAIEGDIRRDTAFEGFKMLPSELRRRKNKWSEGKSDPSRLDLFKKLVGVNKANGGTPLQALKLIDASKCVTELQLDGVAGSEPPEIPWATNMEACFQQLIEPEIDVLKEPLENFIAVRQEEVKRNLVSKLESATRYSKVAKRVRVQFTKMLDNQFDEARKFLFQLHQVELEHAGLGLKFEGLVQGDLDDKGDWECNDEIEMYIKELDGNQNDLLKGLVPSGKVLLCTIPNLARAARKRLYIHAIHAVWHFVDEFLSDKDGHDAQLLACSELWDGSNADDYWIEDTAAEMERRTLEMEVAAYVKAIKVFEKHGIKQP